MKRSLYGLFLIMLVFLLVVGATFYFAPLKVGDAGIRFRLWRHGVRSRYVNVDGYRIHYFEAPAAKGKAGTPLLLIHGLAARGEDWAPMIPTLCDWPCCVSSSRARAFLLPIPLPASCCGWKKTNGMMQWPGQ